MGRQVGLTDDKLQALDEYDTSPVFTDLERLVLRYTVAITSTPVEVADELFLQLGARFDHRQLVELTSSIAWENYRARFDHAFGIEAEGFSDDASCPLPA